uniref:Uncharacterized protein n=1 Tax=Sphenodon punctatus TaxID=8508 RepID=A0A8D0H4Y4_SPHPU
MESFEASMSKNVKEEITSLQQVIKDITQAVENDSDSMASVSWFENYQHSEFSEFPQLNSSDTDNVLTLVREVLTRRHKAVQALTKQLSASQDSVTSLQQQQKQQEEACAIQRQRLQQLEGEKETLTSQLKHLQSMVDVLHRDHVTLEKAREQLQQQLEVLEQEAWNLRRSNTELQLKGDSTDGEKEEQQQEAERMLREKER